MMKKTYITPTAVCYTLQYATPLLAGSLIGDAVSDDIAIGNDPADNLVREFEFDNEFDFGDDDFDDFME